MNLYSRLYVIAGLGLILVGVGGGLGLLPFVLLGGIALGFALGFGAAARTAERVLGRE